MPTPLCQISAQNTNIGSVGPSLPPLWNWRDEGGRAGRRGRAQSPLPDLTGSSSPRSQLLLLPFSVPSFLRPSSPGPLSLSASISQRARIWAGGIWLTVPLAPPCPLWAGPAEDQPRPRQGRISTSDCAGYGGCHVLTSTKAGDPTSHLPISPEPWLCRHESFQVVPRSLGM